MPKGYELNNIYDAKRALFRKIYTEQIKMLSGSIKKCGFYNSGTYALVIGQIKKGIYDNLGEARTLTKQYNAKTVGANKSSIEQDFMSPIELRLNAIAVRDAERTISGALNKTGLSLKGLQDICYCCGQKSAEQLQGLCYCEEEITDNKSGKIYNVKPIIKKYDESLRLGNYPKGDFFIAEAPEKRKELILSNKQLFEQIKLKLIQLGFDDKASRERIFQRFNSAYYDCDVDRKHNLEITKLLITNNYDKEISLKELEMNYDKLAVIQSNFAKFTGKGGPSLFSDAEIFGKKAREFVIAKHKRLPELENGFYYSYCLTEIEKTK